MLSLVLLTGCTKEVSIYSTESIPALTIATEEAAEVIETKPEATVHEETETVLEQVAYQGLYWMEGEEKPHLRCMIINELDQVMTVESVSAKYYLNGIIVWEDLDAPLANPEKKSQPLGYLDSICLWVINDLSIGEYDVAHCTATLISESGEQVTQEFRFTTDETKESHADPFDVTGFSYATLDNNNWGFWYFPENTTEADVTLEGWYWRNYMDGEPVVSGTFTMKNLPGTASKLKTLFAGETTVHNNGISVQWCNYNQREDVFVWRNAQGEPYVQRFCFVLDEAKAGRVLDIVFPEEGNSRHEYKVTLEDPDHYASVIDFYDCLKALGEPEYTVSQIREMIEFDLTLDEIAQQISTYADLLQYLYIKGYKTSSESDIHFNANGIDWSVNKTADRVFNSNTGNCGGGSILVNYILQDDYEEQGYIHETWNDSGHVFNYFRKDGIYYFVDLMDLVTTTNTYENSDFVLGYGTDPKEISNDRVNVENEISMKMDGSQVWMQVMLPCQVDQIPVGWNNQYLGGEGPELPYVFPEEIEESLLILYKKDTFGNPGFVPGPAKSRWPSLAK